MQIYCEGCRKPQHGAERKCGNCGNPFGGGWSTLLIGGALAAFLPVGIWFSNEPEAIRDPRLLCWFELPILTMTAFLYDYHPRRRALYFWGGVSAILASLFVLTR